MARFSDPPIHIHHAHIFPYSLQARGKKIKKVVSDREDYDHHHVLFQSHGDSSCKEEEGGHDCLFDILDKGEGYRVDATNFDNEDEDGVRLVSNFQLNDVRSLDLADHNVTKEEDGGLEYYLEYTLLYKFLPEITDDGKVVPTHSHVQMKPISKLHIGNPADAFRGTYLFPHTEHYNTMWFQYKHEFFGPGLLKNYILHTHQTIFDSFFIFKSRQGTGTTRLNRLLEKYTKEKNRDDQPEMLPIFHDKQCQSSKLYFVDKDIDDIRKSKIDREYFDDEKDRLLNLIQDAMMEENDQPSIEVVCEVTKPSLYFSTEDNHARDRQVQFNCLKDGIHLNTNDTLTIVTFNHARNPQHLAMDSPEFQKSAAFGSLFAFYQHTIFRGDFVSDEISDDINYFPGYYKYSPRYGHNLYNYTSSTTESTCPVVKTLFKASANITSTGANEANNNDKYINYIVPLTTLNIVLFVMSLLFFTFSSALGACARKNDDQSFRSMSYSRVKSCSRSLTDLEDGKSFIN